MKQHDKGLASGTKPATRPIVEPSRSPTELTDRDHTRDETHSEAVPVGHVSPEYRALVFLADMLDDVEAERIAAENRQRSAEAEGLTNFIDSAFIAEHVDQLRRFEGLTVKRLEKAVKSTNLSDFVLAQKGVGLKTTGRLLGVIGDPSWHPVEDRPRTVSELWAYCGLNPEAPDKKRGMTQEDALKRGNPRARKALYVITTGFVKTVGGPYRKVYDERKAVTEGRTHAKVCRNTVKPVAGAPSGSNGCGTQAHPEWGEIGSPWRDGHRHADAMRIAAKTFLKDLYEVSKSLRDGQPSSDTQSPAAIPENPLYRDGQNLIETHGIAAVPVEV